MRRTVQLWLKGLVAAVISGGAQGVTTGLAAIGIAPETFNLDAGMEKTIQIAAFAAIVAAVGGAAAYLKQSPLPPDPKRVPEVPHG